MQVARANPQPVRQFIDRSLVEKTVVDLRGRGRTNRPAINAGGLHCDEEFAVEAGIAAEASPIESAPVEGKNFFHQARRYTARNLRTSHFRTFMWTSNSSSTD